MPGSNYLSFERHGGASLHEIWPVKLCHVSRIAQKKETGVLADEKSSLAQEALFVLATYCGVN